MSGDLAETAYGIRQHARTATRFRGLTETIDTDQAQLPDAVTAADESTRALDRDERRRAAQGPHLTTSDAVHTALTARLRTRISTAVASGAVLPVWFTTALGHRPTPTDAELWIETATAVLTYRLTYAVTDPLVALGQVSYPPPRRT